MKKSVLILIVFITFSNFSNGQRCEQIAIDTVECVIGSDLRFTINYDWVHASSPAQKVKTELLSMNDQPLNNFSYGDFSYCNDGNWGDWLFRMATLKIKFKWDTLYSDPMYRLKISTNIPNIVGDYGIRIRNLIVKPRYPILKPILDSVYYCGDSASFSFAALGLDEDTLYSYEIDTSGYKIAGGKGTPVVVLDDIINNESYFNHIIRIRGFYRGSAFKYKYSSIDDKIFDSEWITKIRGPEPKHMKYAQQNCKESEIPKICLNFYYDVDNKPYFPSICDSVYKVGSIPREYLNCFGGIIQIEPSAINFIDNKPIDLIVTFFDQKYKNPITKIATINPTSQKP